MDMPNMPEPVNGPIKSYDASHRSFTRPYSAKNIVFYKDGDEHFQGIRMPVSKAKYRTMDSLMDDLTDRIPLSFGVRRVFTPHGRTEVQSVDQLQHQGKYVCSSSKWARKLNLSAVDRIHRLRMQAAERERSHRRAKSHGDTVFASSSAALKQKEKLKAVRTTQTPPIPQRPKQILFVLNGSNTRVYRSLIRVQRLPLFDELLTEVSQGLQTPIHKVFTFDGRKIGSVEELVSGPPRVLACQRHERPQLEPNSHKFPPIQRPTNHSSSNGEIRAALKENLSNKRKINDSTKESSSVTSLPPLPPGAKQRKPTGQENRNQLKNQRRQSPAKKSKAPSQKKGNKAGSFRNKEQVDAVTKIQAGVRGYMTRKQLKSEHSAAAKIQAGARGYLTRKKNDHFTVLEGSDVEWAAFRIQAAFRAFRKWKQYKTRAEIRQKKIRTLSPEATKACIVIQAAYRGHRTRRNIWHPPRLPIEDEYVFDSVSTVDNFEKQEQAAVLIQAAYRGYNVRERLKNPRPNEIQDTKIEKKTKKKKTEKKSSGDITYAVSVFTGNRWGADFDYELFIQLFGPKGDSGKIWLKQQPFDQKFLQNQVDTFDVEIPYLGTLQKISVGHEAEGYGAGSFLERVIISDTVVDMKQYVFICSKWLDTCQVDRKLIRTMDRSGVYSLTSMSDALADLQELGEANALSKGRWSLKVHTGKKQEAATTANISVMGFGSFGRSDPVMLADASSFSPGAVSSFQVNFGSIGDLYKLRFQSDEAGTHSGWLLDFVELKDMDTGEEFVLYCGKWLGKQPDRKKKGTAQNFRELPVVRVGIEPLAVVQYSIKILTSSLTGIDSAFPIELHLMGEYGDSGKIKLHPPSTNGNNEPNEIECKLEAVSIGRLWSVNVEFQLDNNGEEFSQGFISLQDIYEKQNISMSSGGEWGMGKVIVRESSHTPYQYMFGDSRIMASDIPGRVKKQMLLSEMEGLATKAKDKKGTKKSEGKWDVWVTSGDHSESSADGVPYITVYGDDGHTQAIPLHDDKQLIQAGQTSTYQILAKDIGLFFKIRLILAPEKGEASWYLKKLKMKDSVTGDELRFPVEMWLDAESVVEMPAIWPDIPPLPLLLYQVTVVTSPESGNDNDFSVSVVIFGDKGDTGKRMLKNAVGTQTGSCFKPGNVDSFEIEAVTVKDIKRVEIGLETSKSVAKWHLETIRIHDPEYNKLYQLDCKRELSTESEDIRVLSLLPVQVGQSAGM